MPCIQDTQTDTCAGAHTYGVQSHTHTIMPITNERNANFSEYIFRVVAIEASIARSHAKII